MKHIIRSAIHRLPYIKGLRQQIATQGEFPAGHYYSPIPDKDEVVSYIKSRKPLTAKLPGITLDQEKQFKLINEYRQYYPDLPFPEKQTRSYRYYYDNDLYSCTDAFFLYCFLRKHQPKKIIEVGSGFSSAVMLDTVDGFFPFRPEMTFIDPCPDRLESLLKSGDENYVRIIGKKIQEIPIAVFETLEAGDFLFIDSSHVVKCGSDLQLLMFEILPVLARGVFVHFHDVFYPFEYPTDWLKKGRFWNEDYILRAFLTNNCEWEIYLFVTFVGWLFRQYLKDNMPLCLKDSGGSLYLRRKREC
jgi:hypothetical protein